MRLLYTSLQKQKQIHSNKNKQHPFCVIYFRKEIET